MSTLYRWLLIMNMLSMVFSNASYGSELQHVDALPNVTIRPPSPDTKISPNQTIHKTLSVKEPNTKATNTHTGRWFYVTKDTTVTFTATAAQGVPVIMISDTPLPPLLSVMNPMIGEEEDPLLGNPIAYKIGTANQVSLSVTPKQDGIWQVWVWVLRRQLPEPETFEPTPELIESLKQQGYTEEQMPLLWTEPEILRAWRGTYAD